MMTGQRRGLAAGIAVTFVMAAATLAGAPADSPVADAAERGDLAEVRSLLRSGADVNAAQTDGMTALHWAAANGDAEIARTLLYAGATVRSTTRLGGYTPLHLAARSGDAGTAGILLEAGADPNAFTSTGVTPLHFAADADAAGVVAALVESGAEVDARDGFSERTPLMFAAVRGADAAAQALLDAGADPSLQTAIKDYEAVSQNLRSDQRRRARLKAAAEEPEEEERSAAARGQTPPPQGPPPPAAAAQAQRQAAQAASRQNQQTQGAQAAQANPSGAQPQPPQPPAEPPVRALSSTQQIGKQGGFTALHYAAREGHRSTASILLEAGTDLDHPTGGDESTPMLVAVINGHYDLARDLLERGADPNLTSDDGAAPLFATLNIEWSLRTWYPQPAAFRQQETSYLELMRLLLDAGADPNQRTGTHIWYAAYNAGRMGVDFTGATPFWRAAYAADVEAMRLLVEYGADPNMSTLKLPGRNRFAFPGAQPEQEERLDPSGLPPVPTGGPAVHPLHAASGVGFGTSRVAQQHRSVPDGWLPAVRYLVDELGVDANLRDHDGFNAIHHAAARGDNTTILFLVSRGADVGAISRRGQTTADLANSPEQRAQPHPATVALLEKLGSQNNHRCRSCGGSR